jgi:hypothetical protein
MIIFQTRLGTEFCSLIFTPDYTFSLIKNWLFKPLFASTFLSSQNKNVTLITNSMLGLEKEVEGRRDESQGMNW